MLKLVPRQSQTDHDDHDQVFISRYEVLLAYARRLVGKEHSRADDLIQDAYIQFTIARPNLAQINNLNAYLTTLVRNLHVSWLRRTTAHRTGHIALYEFDSAVLALASSTNDERFRARDELVRICEFACTRKETSKAASVLLLRFFHDFYPSEIARIVCATPQAVNSWLWQARREARVWLDDPARLRIAGQPGAPLVEIPVAPSDDSGETITRLRAAIFSTHLPPCISPRVITQWGAAGNAKTLDIATFAHVASCGHCLRRICAHLELSSDEAHPPDGEAGGLGGGVSFDERKAFQNTARRRARGTREHRPRQLQVSVNGHHVGVVRVESAHNDVRWTVRLDEPVAFAELHSEQGLRMALLLVELPPEGSLVQHVRVELTDNRSLQLTLDFSELHPAVALEYVDPALALAIAHLGDEDADTSPGLLDDSTERHLVESSNGPRWPRIREYWQRYRLVPVTSGLALLLTLAAWWAQPRQPATPDATTLIEEAAASEASAVPSSRAVHRTLELEMRRADTETVTFTHRIETWSRADANERAVRVFDRTGHLIAGLWNTEGREDIISLGLLEETWQADLSAGAFRTLYASVGPCATAEEPDRYTVTCERVATSSLLERLYPALRAQAATAIPSRAMLVLRRQDLHAIRLVLTVPVDGADHIVTLEERTLATVPVADIPPGTFIPERARLPAVSPAASASGRTSGIATPSVEVRLVELIDRLAVGEFVSVWRTEANRLSVSGLVSSRELKRALLNAVSALDVAGAVATDVQTFAEAAAREQGRRDDGTTRTQLLEAAIGSAPIEEHIRAHVSAGVDPDTVVRELTRRVLAGSGTVRRHAVALKAFLERFDESTVERLDEPSRTAWRALLRRHTDACLTALDALDVALVPYFTPGDEGLVATPPTLNAAADHLANEAATIDRALTLAFTASGVVAETESRALALDVRQHIYRARLDARFIETVAQP